REDQRDGANRGQSLLTRLRGGDRTAAVITRSVSSVAMKVLALNSSELKTESKGAIGMIGVRKISHASYETPDLDKQTEYYTDVLGLMLIAKEKNTVYLANTIDHHSIILRNGPEPKCTAIGFQIGPDDDLDAFEKQTAGRGLRTARKKDAEPTIADMVVFEDPKGTIME